MFRLRFAVLVVFVLAAAASRLLPHPFNFAPIGAMALFGGACFSDRRAAFGVPFAAMLLSDFALAFVYTGLVWESIVLMPFVYGGFALTVLVGFLLRGRRKVLPIAAATVAASLIYFVVTNLGDWAVGPTYPRTWGGLVACFVAAIPFFKNTLLGNAVYAAAFFGGLALLEKGLPALREPVSSPVSA